jgi:hypothetical protein
MTTFSATIDASLTGRTVAVLPLVFMDFVDAPRRFAPGFGDLVTGGHTWQGTGDLITIEGLEEDRGLTANVMTFTLSGVNPELVTLARNASDRVKGRRVYVYLQFFDKDTWETLDDPFVQKIGTMDQMRYQADGPSTRRIIVTAEGLWTGRNRPPFGLYSDRDQQARYPGDLGMQQVPNLVSKSIRWPVV